MTGSSADGLTEEHAMTAPQEPQPTQTEGNPVPPAAPPASDKSFTQADIDRIVADRLSRQKASFADYDDLKAKAAHLEAIEAEKATDLEKAVTAAVAETRTQITSTVNGRLIAAEARAQAAAAKFHNPNDITGLIDLSGVPVADDGSVDADAVKALIAARVELSPYLIATDEGPRTPQPNPGQGARPQSPQAAEDAEYAAFKSELFPNNNTERA